MKKIKLIAAGMLVLTGCNQSTNTPSVTVVAESTIETAHLETGN